jgi:septum formation protein
MRLILGSTSPRRREILTYFSLDFEQVSPDFDEEAVPFCGEPSSFVQMLAEGKALSLNKSYSDALILSADTIVYREGKIYGKPKNEEEAFHSLQELQGSWHSVFSGVTVWKDGKSLSSSEETKVLFNALSPVQIKRYLNALHWADKAGGYAIQLAGSLIVKKIEGCYYNVMGLPINTVNHLLHEMGIDLWDHLQ